MKILFTTHKWTELSCHEQFCLLILYILNVCMFATTFSATIASWSIQVMLIPIKSFILLLMFSNKIMQNTSSNYNVSLLLNVTRLHLLQNFPSILPYSEISFNHSSK